MSCGALRRAAARRDHPCSRATWRHVSRGSGRGCGTCRSRRARRRRRGEARRRRGRLRTDRGGAERSLPRLSVTRQSKCIAPGASSRYGRLMFARRTTRWVSVPRLRARLCARRGAVCNGVGVAGRRRGAAWVLGQRRHLRLRPASRHRLALGASSAIRAPVSGEVTFAGRVPTNGLTVTIATGDYKTSLTHWSPRVRSGARVAEGMSSRAGPSGEAEYEFPYVHLGIRVGASESYVDPLELLPPRGTASPPPAPEAPPAPFPQPAPAPPVAAPPAPAPPIAPAAPPAEPVTAPEPSTATAPGPVAAPRALSGGLRISSSKKPLKEATEHSTRSAERRSDERPIRSKRPSAPADRSRDGRALAPWTVAVTTARPARSTMIPGGDGQADARDTGRATRWSAPLIRPSPRRRHSRRAGRGRSDPTLARCAACRHSPRRHCSVRPGGQKATPYHWRPWRTT